jgi:transcriptional regulator with XRE-family HTH domain
LPLDDIGPSLRSARERRGWSRETLAHVSGVSVAAIAQIESGRRKDIRLSSLSALATALEMTLDQLATGAAPTGSRPAAPTGSRPAAPTPT